MKNKIAVLLTGALILAASAWANLKGGTTFRASLNKAVKVRTAPVLIGAICPDKTTPNSSVA
ncbi:MAG: hypothetical protein A2X37_06200 [Elusimicrobia bacterium GWA2_66_18]|nr:MAG: hypothetical protein A2X37_06200 [Elusimicrobia bacterium GWA2_66_18]